MMRAVSDEDDDRVQGQEPVVGQAARGHRAAVKPELLADAREVLRQPVPLISRGEPGPPVTPVCGAWLQSVIPAPTSRGAAAGYRSTRAVPGNAEDYPRPGRWRQCRPGERRDRPRHLRLRRGHPAPLAARHRGGPLPGRAAAAYLRRRGRHALRPAQPADLSPVPRAQHLLLPGSAAAVTVSAKLVNFRLPRRGQYSAAAGTVPAFGWLRLPARYLPPSGNPCVLHLAPGRGPAFRARPRVRAVPADAFAGAAPVGHHLAGMQADTAHPA